MPVNGFKYPEFFTAPVGKRAFTAEKIDKVTNGKKFIKYNLTLWL